MPDLFTHVGGTERPTSPRLPSPQWPAVQLTSSLVVIVDASATRRILVEASLLQSNYEVKGFADGREALRWLTHAKTPTPALVLVDTDLPGLDGYDIIRYLKARPTFAQTRLLMTSQPTILEHLKARLAGARACIARPFTAEDLLSTIQTLTTLQEAGSSAQHL
jgi:CheY-like chemotaxis protein